MLLQMPLQAAKGKKPSLMKKRKTRTAVMLRSQQQEAQQKVPLEQIYLLSATNRLSAIQNQHSWAELFEQNHKFTVKTTIKNVKLSKTPVKMTQAYCEICSQHAREKRM